MAPSPGVFRSVRDLPVRYRRREGHPRSLRRAHARHRSRLRGPKTEPLRGGAADRPGRETRDDGRVPRSTPDGGHVSDYAAMAPFLARGLGTEWDARGRIAGAAVARETSR